MSWNQVLGHDAILQRFRRSVRGGRLASTFLFVGPAGIGKRTFALQLAQSLLCTTHPEIELEPCGRCPSCLQVAAGAHPDLAVVARPADKAFIPLELLIGDDEHRLQEGLCHSISLKPFFGGRKVAVIDDADYLNQEGANCLLKTLEEPPPRSVIILIGTSEQRQLPTIRSRAQVIRFQTLSRGIIEQLLLQHGLVEDAAEARELAELGEGSVQQALEFADPAVREFRSRWLEFLSAPRGSPFAFAKELSSFIDAAGKDAPARRARFKQVVRWGTHFFRQLLTRQHGHGETVDATLEKSLTAAATWMPAAETAANCLERCLDAHAQVEANANQATLLECWLDDLSVLSRRQ